MKNTKMLQIHPIDNDYQVVSVTTSNEAEAPLDTGSSLVSGVRGEWMQ